MIIEINCSAFEHSAIIIYYSRVFLISIATMLYAVKIFCFMQNAYDFEAFA